MTDDHCHKMVHPLAKGEEDYICRKPHYKDGWCKIHHPETIAKKVADEIAWREEMMERESSAAKKTELTIENAILLLVSNGYQVAKINGPYGER